MPYVIVKGSNKTSEPLDATLCDAGTFGPDRRSAVPVKIRRISDRVLAVDGEPRAVIWCRGGNGQVTYLIDAGTKALHNRAQRIALDKAHALLNQLAAAMRPLTAASAEPELGIEGLGELFNWFSEEHERLASAPRCAAEESNNEQ